MNVFESQQHFSKVKLGLLLCKSASLLKHVKQLTTRAELHHKVQVVLALKCMLEFYDERVVK